MSDKLTTEESQALKKSAAGQLIILREAMIELADAIFRRVFRRFIR